MSCALLSLVLMAWPLSAPASSAPDAAAERLAERLRPIEYLTAEFTQTVTGARHQILQRAEGRLFLARPLRFRWELDAPYEQLVVTDDDRLYLYDPDLAQVTVEPLGEALQGTPALILAGELDDIERTFTVAVETRDGTEIFELSPRSPDSMYTRLSMRFENGRLARLDIVDALDQRTRVELTDVTINEPLDPALFTFEIPPDTDVIGDVSNATD